MSYILDALKKSDYKRRQQYGGKKIHAAQPRLPRPVREERPRRWWLLLGLTAVLFTTVGLFIHSRIASLSPSTRDAGGPGLTELPAENPHTVSAAGEISPAPATEAATSIPPAEPTAAKAASPPPAASAIPELQPAQVKMPAAGSEAPIVPEAQASAAQAQDPPAKPAQEALQEIPRETAEVLPAIPLLDDLDPLLRQAIPEFRLAGHVYSDAPELRMIIINNSVVRENDVVEQGYVLEEIDADSIILRRGELRFRLPVD